MDKNNKSTQPLIENQKDVPQANLPLLSLEHELLNEDFVQSDDSANDESTIAQYSENAQRETDDEESGAVLFGLDCSLYDIDASMQELSLLAKARGLNTLAIVVQKRESAQGATVLGIGRLEEGRELCENLDAKCAIFDCELSGSQIKNIENILNVPVIDRTMLILEIFASRAITNEGKIQSELAMLQYRLPRLAGLGDSLSRQGGGGGGGGGARRGAGESRLEYDRRYIRKRIDTLNDKLKNIKERRQITRKSRQKNAVPVVALVGYTNVGKSSLLNTLCGASVLEKDMLFATLDPTARSAKLPNGMQVIFVDTVGFVSRLPHNLVKAFQSTLEEAKYADLILKVCDASNPETELQLEITDEVLTELGCGDIGQITVYNKADKIENNAYLNENALFVSAKTNSGIENLLLSIQNELMHKICALEILLPYDKLNLANCMRNYGKITSEEFLENGVLIKGNVRTQDLHILKPYEV